VYSFYPVEERTRYRLGRQATHERPYIPGYVFARFPGAPWWHLILGDTQGVADRPVNGWDRQVADTLRQHRTFFDVIRYTGSEEPAWLVEGSLSSLMGMRSRAELLEEKRRRGMTIRKGDRVRIKDGVPAMAGFTGEILALKSTRGVVEIMLFGRVCEVEIELDRMEKVA
jgi:transcription antitermination factor NusG